jgi:soluble lytic murein transglycosylase
LKRPILLILILIGSGFLFAYELNDYWVNRFNPIILRHSKIYNLHPDLVWSVIYEETYFRPWRVGADGEIGLMQVTPTVGREWASQTGMRELEKQMAKDPYSILRDPEQNIQIGCWYLEKLQKIYRDSPEVNAQMLAAYNAGPSRVTEWKKRVQSDKTFIELIDIPSTRAYVTSILTRFYKLKEDKDSLTQKESQK